MITAVLLSLFLHTTPAYAQPVCGNNVCEEGEATQCFCPPDADQECMAPCALGACPADCTNKKTDNQETEHDSTTCYFGDAAYAPDTSFPAGDGCNTCTCSNTGFIACTQMECVQKDEEQETYKRHDRCTSTQQCSEGFVCTTEYGECMSLCVDTTSYCPDVCAGECVPVEEEASVEYEDEVRTVQRKNPFSDILLDTEEGVAAVTLYDAGVINGFPDKTFRKDELVNRAQAAKMLLLAKYGSVPDAVHSNMFWDVYDGEWYVPYIVLAARLGIIKGYSNGSFGPQYAVNTAEFLKMLSETFALPLGGTYVYSDVPQDAWFAPYAAVAYQYDLLPNRPIGLLQPARAMTRGEVVVAIKRLLDVL